LEDIKSILHDTIGKDLRLPLASSEVAEYFHKGDRLSVNLKTGELCWDTVHPGEMFSSKLSLRLHQWLMKGLIVEIA